jgi:hypothetical protein
MNDRPKMTQQVATSLERLASESCVGVLLRSRASASCFGVVRRRLASESCLGVLLRNDSTRLRHAVTSRGVWGQTAKYVIDKHPRLCFAINCSLNLRDSICALNSGQRVTMNTQLSKTSFLKGDKSPWMTSRDKRNFLLMTSLTPHRHGHLHLFLWHPTRKGLTCACGNLSFLSNTIPHACLSGEVRSLGKKANKCWRETVNC